MARTVKQIIIVRHDLQMNKGKFAIMVAHASVEASLHARQFTPKLWREWNDEGCAKICLQAIDLEHLLSLHKETVDAELNCALITDSGKTVFKEETIVSLAIGPDRAEAIDRITKNLKLW